jgi:hypothetical protein
MLVEAGIICFLLYWIANEYVYSSFFRAYVDQVILGYSPVFGLALGLGGSMVCIFLIRNLRIARRRLETVAVPKIRVAVDKIGSSIPAPGAGSLPKVVTEQVALQSQAPVPASPAEAVVPGSELSGKIETKKESS